MSASEGEQGGLERGRKRSSPASPSSPPPGAGGDDVRAGIVPPGAGSVPPSSPRRGPSPPGAAARGDGGDDLFPARSDPPLGRGRPGHPARPDAGVGAVRDAAAARGAARRRLVPGGAGGSHPLLRGRPGRPAAHAPQGTARGAGHHRRACRRPFGRGWAAPGRSPARSIAALTSRAYAAASGSSIRSPSATASEKASGVRAARTAAASCSNAGSSRRKRRRCVTRRPAAAAPSRRAASSGYPPSLRIGASHSR